MLNGLQFRHAAGAAMVAWLLTAVPPLGAQEVRQQRVLVLYAGLPGSPGPLAYENTFQEILPEALGQRLDLHHEYIDLARFGDPGYSATLADFLKDKYAHLPPDVVIATTGLSRQFAEKFRSRIFPAAPIVFIDRLARSHRDANTTGLDADVDMGATIDLAIALQPDLERVFVIGGVSAYDLVYQRMARDSLGRLESRVDITYLTTLTFAELERTVRALPPRSAIFFVTLTEDSGGARIVSLDAAARLAAIANAPTYGWNDIAMDRNIVGGHLYRNEVVAARSADVALRILRGERADDLPIISVDAHTTQLDWRQLRRWQIDESLVPAGATVLFREPTLWDRYKVYISGALVLIVLQTALIAGLLLQRRQRRRAELAMVDNQQMLEQSHRQVSELFGRLIAAQETERSRIARDLHDDVSQRVAALSIAMSNLKQKLAGNPAAADPIAALSAMQRDAGALANQIRTVSHDLHPSTLRHAGLVSALRGFCVEFGAMHALSVGFSAPADLGPIADDAALCLYRVTQEALRNVVKHAEAHHVTVALSCANGELHLSIADDGVGFEPAGVSGAGRGLGLISIDERVRLLGGQLFVDTQPGSGTRLSVSIPEAIHFDRVARSHPQQSRA